VRVAFAYDRFSHHAARSGYTVLAEAVAARVPARTLNGCGTVPRALEQRLLQRSGMPQYSARSLQLELSAARRLCLGRGEICHLLYAEQVYRYLGALRGVGRLTGGRLVCTYHQPPDLLRPLLPEARILRRVDALMAFSPDQAEYLASLVGPERVHVVPHPVDTDYFHPPPDERRDGGTCLFVGAWLRDFELLRSVVRQTAARGGELRFRIVTRRERLDELSGPLPATEVLTGISDAALLESYQRAGVFMLPLLDSTGNNALLEALACGLPVVVTDVGGVREHVDESCAVLVPRGDAEAMCEAVLALAADETRRHELSLAARARALELGLGPVAERQIEVYRAIAA
jgi:glycosyltransferase involved in cell wall biosynthesis